MLIHSQMLKEMDKNDAEQERIVSEINENRRQNKAEKRIIMDAREQASRAKIRLQHPHSKPWGRLQEEALAAEHEGDARLALMKAAQRA